ncbi:hypothetical protein LUZ60_001629 [Juncus effusus]|nr:hypothetical protein LUZ60_001629 [Juncus effusus]
MDKGKNRNDLLAAGRKKLQQYRKKKDHKGSSSSNSNSGNTKQKASEKRTDLDAEVSKPTSEQENTILDSNNESRERLEDDSGGILVNSDQPSSNLSSNNETKEKLEDDSGEISVNSDQTNSNLTSNNEIKEKLEDGSGEISVNSDQLNSNLASSDNEIREKLEDDSGEVLVNLTTGSDLATENQSTETEAVSTRNETPEEKNDQEDASINQEISNSGFGNQMHEVIIAESNSNSNSEQAGLKTDRDFNNPDPKPDLTEQNSIQLNEILLQDGIESLESIEKELYLTAISKDSIELQLNEQTGLNSEMFKLVEDKEKVIVQCKSELQETTIAKEKAELQLSEEKEKLESALSQLEGLERENISMKEERERVDKEKEIQLEGLERENASIKEEKEKLEREREIQLEVLERENVSLKEEKDKLERERETQMEGLERENVSLKEEREKLKREREILSSENTKLSTELSDQNERLVQLESKIKESSTTFERLIQENIFLSTSLDLNKLILIESEEKSNQISPNSRFLNVHMNEVRGILGDFKNSIEKIKSGNSGSFNKKGGITDLIKAFESKSNNDEVLVSEKEIPVGEREIPESSTEYSLESTVQLAEKLELALSRLEMDLITENKGAEKEEDRSREVECNNAIQEKIEGLSLIFENYGGRIENLQERFSTTQKEADDESARLLSQLEELQKEVDGKIQKLLEEKDKTIKNVSDAIVRFNSSTGLLVPAELAPGEGADVSDSLFALVVFAAQSIESLRVKNETLSEKNEISIWFARKMRDSLKTLVNNDSEEEKNEKEEDLSLIFESYEGLIANAQNLLEEHDDLVAKNKDLESGLLSKTKEAEELSVKCESFAEKNEVSIGFARKMHNSLQKLVNDSDQEKNDKEEDLSLIFESYEGLIANAQNLLQERADLVAKNKDLESGLLRKTKEAEEFSVKCESLAESLNDFCLIKGDLESDLMSKNSILEDLYARCVALAEKLPENSEIGSGDNKDCNDLLNSVLPKLEASISSLLEREKEIDLAKKCLYEADISSEISPDKWALPLPVLLNNDILPQFIKMAEKMDVLSTSNVQLQTEIEVLRDSSKQLEASSQKTQNELNNKMENLSASNIQLQTEIEVLRDSLKELEASSQKTQIQLKDKIAELELSEQRLASVKEKLGIAVTKGKGLIVQRDGLKQSLLEISSELERCKEKLKSSTVERIEALESELSYIRNSANVMRDSFLIRDSVIQRIEEVLEEFEFPEEFYEKEIVEKIEFLAHLAVRRNENSREIIAGDGNENSREIIAGDENDNFREIAGDENENSREIAGDENSGEVQVETGAGFEADDLKNRYNNLERRFYELAEQNNMLEQSLHERNGLIHKWEEFIGRITIIPSQISDPSDRIQWLVSALRDAETEREFLQSKIDSLEESSEMLIVDLEGSCKRISELNAEISGVKSEKEFFCESLDKLRFDYEVEREGLRKQLAGLRDTISKKIEDESEIMRLVDFVGKELNDEGVLDELASRGSSVKCLDKLVRKLLEERNNNTLLPQTDDLSRSVDFDEINALRSQLDEALEKNQSLVFNIDGLNEKYEELVKNQSLEKAALNARMNELSEEGAHSSELVAELEKQRDVLQVELQQLKENQLRETEALNERIKGLELEREKHLQLISELERQRDLLQEQLSQVREKLNVAVRKGKSLVQHRDGLKQQIETLENEKSSLLNQLEASSQHFNGFLTVLNSFDLDQDGLSSTDPIKKLEIIGKMNNDLRVKAAGAETEASKSRRATELLLVELNESQERADLLQEELERIGRKQMEEMREMNLAIGKLMNSSFEILESLGGKVNNNAGLISHVEAFVGSLGNNRIDGSDSVSSFVHAIVKEISNRKRNHAEYNNAFEQRTDEWNENLISYIHNSVQELNDIKTSIENESSLTDQKCENLFKSMSDSQTQIESLISDLRQEIREKERENSLIVEEKTKEFKSSVVQLQRELQEKELQVSTVSAELASQIREKEAKINVLERKVGEMEMEKQSLLLRINELQEAELSRDELHERVNYYTEMLTKKEQEVESLMQALDEEEKEMEELEMRNKRLENQLEEKDFTLKSLEASRSKTLNKLTTTITKFDELHNLSESLLSEIESLQSQLDSRDSEISFLRQEVTKITNELLISEESNKKNNSQLTRFAKRVETLVLKLGLSFEESEEFEFERVSGFMEVLDRKFAELDELRASLQSKDAMLQNERGKIVNLTRKCEALENSLSERSVGTSASSSVLEIEQSREKVMNARGGARKGNNSNINNNNNGDQVAIAIEMDDDANNRPLDEDDDKAHGFKALTKSRFVPRFTRPISDRVDGIWVSGDRWLMRHPTLRLGVLIYWIALHAMLASFI